MNSTIAKMKQDDTYKQISERIMNMEKKILDMGEKCMNMEKKILDIGEKGENRSDEPKGAHEDQNQGKAVVTGFHSETSESEVEQLQRETMTKIGMPIENSRIECPAKSITHAFIYFKSDDEGNKYIRSANMLRKELRGRKLKITRSMDAEERFCQKRMGYVRCCIHMKHDIPLNSISMNWTSKHVSVKRPDCGENNQKKTHRNDCEQSRDGTTTQR